MRNKFETEMEIPEGVNVEYADDILKISKSGNFLEKKVGFPTLKVSLKSGKINLSIQKANKKDIAKVKSVVAHIKNLFAGLEQEFKYELEICFVHFPITTKLEGRKFLINNFLGEKISRKAFIPEGVNVKIDGQKIILSGKDLEKTGQAAANLENATKISKRDRRVFQDGIFITSKPGREQ